MQFTLKKFDGKEYKRRFEKRILTNVDKFKCFIFKRKINVIAIICICILCCGLIKKLPQNLIISFIDVGQGDCTLITSKERKKYLN